MINRGLVSAQVNSKSAKAVAKATIKLLKPYVKIQCLV